MRQGITTALVGATALIAGVLVAPQAAVADEPDTPCTAEISIDLDPGVGLQPSSGSFTSGGESGGLSCTGKIGGREVTAGGKGGAIGKYGVDGPNSCAKLDGKTAFRITATLPGTGGDIKFSDDVLGQYGPLQGNFFFGGSFQGKKSYGTFKFTPVDSDCVVRPVKKLFAQVTAWAVNGSPDGAAVQRMQLD
ncbi:MAG: hypothetical protein ACT4QF_13435 [Sporichthyaceae bacterium]